ncbi:MAG: Rieske 2Fe-2S domain-containing protein [Acidobacteriota bacterium]
MVCPSRELRPGAVRRFALGDHPIVLFRGRENGTVHALPAHCEHQGVDLARGTVVGDRLRCPLHHWEYSNRCEHVPGANTLPRSLAAPRYVTTERFGMVFLHAGPEPGEPLPGFSTPDGELSFRAGTPVNIDCPWYVPVANAFDMTHLETVHRRQLTRTPSIHTPTPLTFRVDYATSVTGDGWSDRAMRWLSGNDIRVDVTCFGGTMILVESSIRNRRGYLMVSLRPTSGGVSILPMFGVPRRAAGLHRIHGRFSAALFMAFLRRDVETLSGIRFPDGYLDNRDATINACYRYLCTLPSLDSEEVS